MHVFRIFDAKLFIFTKKRRQIALFLIT
jgi:hypothetical protein